MRRVLASVLMAGLVAGSLTAPAEAGKKKKKARTAVVAYTSPSVGSADATGTCTDSCVRFGVGSNERWLRLEIADDSGLPPAATIGQDTDPSNATVERVGEICGSTEEPIAITPGAEVIVWVWAAPRFVAGDGPCLGIGSSGEVTATLSATP